VVSDLVRHRPIWFGGQDRSEASMDELFKSLGPRKSAGIRIAVMDMWKPFATRPSGTRRSGTCQQV
jgi:transposase